MKLRNKKTGDIVNAMFYAPMANYDLILWKDKLDPSCHEVRLGNYKTLAELNEEWEDYEPLIKDEKIRKAVRAWAEANGVDRVILGQVNGDELVKKSPMTAFGCNISFEGSLGLERGRNYTIKELCGEEEE